MGIPKGKMIVKSKTTTPPVVDPNDGLTEEERKLIKESEQIFQDQPQPIQNVSQIKERKLGIDTSGIDITPISFGENFDHIPIIDVVSVLPSGGFSYPKNYWIKYRPFVFGEISKISNDKMSFTDIARIVLSGIKTSFPIEELTFYDFTFISLLRKLSSLRDSQVRVTHACSRCKKLNTYIINVSSGEDSDLNFWEIKYNNLPIKVDLKFDNNEYKEYEFSPLTISQYFYLCNIGMEKDICAMIAAQCTNESFEVMYDNVCKAVGEEETLLREIDDILTHGLKPIASQCDACGAVTMLRVDSNKVILRPFRRPNEVIKDRIRFG